MFEQIADNTDWDLSAPLIWGFFFTDASAEKLRAVVPALEQDGYRFVDVFLADKDEPAVADLWMLHVEKIEVHTPDSLDQRNDALYRFAAEHELGAYDGMDVAPVDAEED
nr:ribonuclease E inhibitor RraB [Luteibacter sp. dw_328]